MAYQINIPKSVQQQLNHLPEPIYTHIIEDISLLQNNPQPLNAIKIKNHLGYRIQIGDYRILYEIDDQSQIIILRRVEARNKIYHYE